jgi:recombination protein RecR
VHEALEKVASLLARLPGVGKRSAERMTVALARQPPLMRDLAVSLRDLDARVSLCDRCGNLTARDQNPCRLCTDSRRDDAVLCVVEDPGDIVLIERSGAFRGRYFALMGKFSPGRGEGPQNTRVESLIQRVAEGLIQEVILALNADVESDATSSFLRDALKSRPIRVTRLARGIPAGSGVAYSDSVTLAGALSARQPL